MSRFIIPLSDILISGVHCASAVPVEVSDSDAAAMLAQGFAQACAASSVAKIETAALDVSSLENASASYAKKQK